MNIGILSTSRADLGIFTPLIKELSQDPSHKVFLYLGGAHSEPGDAYQESVQHLAGIHLIKLDRSLYFINSSMDVCKAMINTQKCLLEKLENQSEKIDLFFVLGDRFEMYASASLICTLQIPIAHLHGGEVTFGAIDDKYRHATTQLSDFHFVSCLKHKMRIVQMGINPDYVFDVGALSLSGIQNENLLSKDDLSKSTGIDFHQDVCLFTYHPETYGDINPEKDIQEIIAALEEFPFQILITGVNQDPANEIIRKYLLNYQAQHTDKVVYIESLGRSRYFSACRYAKLMVGNSSSGIIEAASFNLPVVNIGNRQLGREQSVNTLNTNADKSSVVQTIQAALKLSGQSFENIYFKDRTASQINQILKTKIEENLKLHRSFHEIIL